MVKWQEPGFDPREFNELRSWLENFTMNRENEEQRPVSQTICGALQKEPNCKCLVLSVLIYGCLAAVTWCRCANVTKVVINFSRYPIKSTKHVSPCDDGYIYIPVAFMGMLYLVYLVECYHSPIRIDLLHAESQDSVLSKLSQLKAAQPTIWWKAVSYHYVRRKRQITRYRNGDNYTTTQVYYERINTHAATSFYYYDYCGVKDISKELVLDPKIPITKIALTKGFAFSNMRSATEFEEARSRFFAEQELRDDYMEMREGLDLGYNPNPTTLVAVLGNPWFTNCYVYWCLSALLLSWPLRVIIEYKTQYADYQVTKLFGVNYDTPTGTEPIHTSISQLTITQPGSYMLAPSYSEALLMDPAPTDLRPVDPENLTEIVPSYSEALLYERAEQGDLANAEAHFVDDEQNPRSVSSRECSCPCHTLTSELNELQESPAAREAYSGPSNEPTNQPIDDLSTSPCSVDQMEGGKCGSCGRFSVEAQLENLEAPRGANRAELGTSASMDLPRTVRRERANGAMPRDMSEPNLRLHVDSIQPDTRFLLANGRSLRNILESEEAQGEERIESAEHKVGVPEAGTQLRSSLSSLDESAARVVDASRGAIPKRTVARSRVIANPIEGCDRLPSSKTYFCLKSILKQNKRRYTLITARELQNFSDREDDSDGRFDARSSYHEGYAYGNACGGRFNLFSRSRESLDGTPGRRKRQLLENSGETGEAASGAAKRESSRTLIFASPIQEICPGDPFGGKGLVRTRREEDASSVEEPSHAVLTHLGRSLTCDRKTSRRRLQEACKHRYLESHPSSFSCPIERYPYPFSASTDAVDIVDAGRNETARRVYPNGTSFPPYEGSTSDSANGKPIEHPGPIDRVFPPPGKTELTRSLTERRAKPARNESGLRRSFTGRVEDYRAESGKRTNLNMETSL